MPPVNLREKFPQMTPVKSAPSMFRVNGCGPALYGSRDRDAETASYVTTLCVAILFVPIFALRAYRVARAPTGGWYFLGREPLSKLAKFWNICVVAAAIVGAGAFAFDKYTTSRGYRERAEMAEAESLVSQGQLANAAKIYQSLYQGHGPESGHAQTELKQLMDSVVGGQTNPPLGETAALFTVLLDAARRDGALPVGDVTSGAMSIVSRRGDTDPAGAIALLDAIRPAMTDTRPLDEKKLPLLQKWVAKEPNNPDAVVPLASLLDGQHKTAEAKKLLLPVKDKLSDGEGARVLGLILAHEGDFAGAHPLLWPYVKPRLDTLHAAETEFGETEQRLWQREIASLKNNEGPKELYNRLEHANHDQQQAMIQEYVNPRIKDDPQFVAAEESLVKASSVVPVALELGMVVLQRANAASPDERKPLLQDAESVFLAIGGVAGQTDVYKLALAQVDYWLGKHDEGKKLFDDFLTQKQRDYKSLLEVAGILRQVGVEPEARPLMEEAYGKAANDDERSGAATQRAIAAIDQEDRIAWLKKSSSADPFVQSELATALGWQAYRAGRDDEAARQFQTSIDLLSKLPREATSLNSLALAYHALFTLNGDPQALARCADCFQQAADLSPRDSILMYNAAVELSMGVANDVLKSQLDLRALKQPASFALFSYLYANEAERDALIEKVKDHPGLAKSVSLFEKAALLSPKSPRTHAEIFAIRDFLRDTAGLNALDDGLAHIQLNASDQLDEVKKNLSGANDEKEKESLAGGIARAEQALAALQAKHDRTTAVAMSMLATQLAAKLAFDGQADGQRIVDLAEKANSLAPSAATGALLAHAHLTRAAANLRGKDPAFDAYCKTYYRALAPDELVVTAMESSDTFKTALLADPDVKKAIDIHRRQLKDFPNGTIFEWAILQAAGEPEAADAAEAIRKSPNTALEVSIELKLNPYSATAVMNAYRLSKLLGHPEAARDAIATAKSAGVPLPPMK